jgi:hypothetical protein
MSKDKGWLTGPELKAHIEKAIKDRDKDDYEVGYGKPPVKSRWKPGQCGNPKGRPRKLERANTERQLMRYFSDALNREVSITIEGKKTKMPFIEAIIHQGAAKAASGDIKFFREIVMNYRLMIETVGRLNPHVTSVLENVERRVAECLEDTDPALTVEINKYKRKTRSF